MKTRLEKSIVKQIMKKLNKNGGFWVKIHGGPFQKVLPDIIGCEKGRFIGIEVKRPGKKPTKIQEYILEEIEKAGGIAFWVDTEEGIYGELQRRSAK